MLTANELKRKYCTEVDMAHVQRVIEAYAAKGRDHAIYYSSLSDPQLQKLKDAGYTVDCSIGRSIISW